MIKGRLRAAAVCGVVVACACWGPVASAVVVVAYNTGTNAAGGITASESLAGITPLSLSRGPGVVQGNTSGSYSAEGFATGTTRDANDYFEWGWSAASQPLNLTTLDLRYDRANTNGPRQLEIAASVNGGPFTTFFTDPSITAAASEDQFNIDLSQFTNVTSATFRLFAFDSPSAASGSVLAIENYQAGPARGITVNGTVVPEPSSALVALAVALGCAVRPARRCLGR